MNPRFPVPLRRNPSRHLLALTIATLLAGAALAPAAWSAEATAVQRFDLQAEPLKLAVERWSQQTGVRVEADARTLAGVTSSPVHGHYSAGEALAALVQGTGLRVVQGPDGFAISGDRATALDKVEVNSSRVGYATERTSSATKTDTPLRDVPQSVTVVGQQLIRDQAMQSMADVVRNIPGFGMAQGEGNRDAPVLRGTPSTADFFVDGLRDDTQYFRDLYNIERVEGLKGPIAMIFGRGGSGGLINRVTKVADFDDGNELSFLAGSWRNLRLTGDTNHAINDRVAFRVTGVYEDSDTYRDGVSIERRGINPTVAFKPGDATRIVLGYEYFDDDRVADRGIPSLAGRPYRTGTSTFYGDPDQSPTGVTIHAFNALVEHRFDNGLELRNSTRVADYDKFYQNVFPGAINVAAGTVAIAAYNNQTDRRNTINQTDLTWVASTGSVQHTLLGGIELARQETDNLRLTGYFTGIGPNVTTFNAPLASPRISLPLEFRQSATDAQNHGIAETKAIYLQDQIEFSPQWSAIVGVRHDSFDVDFTNRRNGVETSTSDSLLSPRAGLIYKPVEAVSLYGSYSIAYVPRAGEQLSSLSPTNAAFDPEKFKNLEIGLKWDVMQDLAFTAAAYRLDRTNVVVPDPNDPTLSILVDGQRVEGVELGLAGNLTENWSVMAGYAWQDGTITATQSATVTRGKTLAQVPRHSVSLWNRYDFSPTWGVGLGAIHRSSIYASTDNLVELPGFSRFDGAVYYTISPRLQTQLNIENLLDKRYYPNAHSNTNITPGSPRAVRLSLTAQF